MSDLLSVGVDVGQLDRKGLDVVALDGRRALVRQLRRASLADLVNLVEELHPDVVCIDAPSRWAPAGARRACEQQLTRLGLNLFTTPSEDRAGAFHEWMRGGFAVYDAVSHLYPRYEGGPVRGRAAEYFPHASAVALAGYIPPLRDKWPFRRSVLETHRIAVSVLKSQDQVDATLGALTGLIALEDGHTWLGSGIDTMLLPARPLPIQYLRR